MRWSCSSSSWSRTGVPAWPQRTAGRPPRSPGAQRLLVVPAHRKLPLGRHVLGNAPQLRGGLPVPPGQPRVGGVLLPGGLIVRVQGLGVRLKVGRHGVGHPGEPGRKHRVLRHALATGRLLLHSRFSLAQGQPIAPHLHRPGSATVTITRVTYRHPAPSNKATIAAVKSSLHPQAAPAGGRLRRPSSRRRHDDPPGEASNRPVAGRVRPEPDLPSSVSPGSAATSRRRAHAAVTGTQGAPAVTSWRR
jgi:hypothetical protein